MLGQDALNEGGFVADGLQLAEGFVIVEKPDVMGRKIAFAQNVLEFPTLQASGANDGDAKQTAPTSSVGAGCSWCFRSVLHQAWEASSCGGGGGNCGRRKMYESRAKTPASV